VTIDQQLRFAITSRHLMQVRYDGRDRIVEPHDYGVFKKTERVLVYQLRAPARPGKAATGWRLLDAAKIEAVKVLEDTFPGSRGPAHDRHLDWDVVYARVD
jgi:hypothetical protein